MGGMMQWTVEPIDLMRDKIKREALEEAAKHLETQGGNAIYMQAWKKAARLVRDLKPD